MSNQSAEFAVVYKEVLGFPGYRVGSDGSIWSCWRPAGPRLGWRISSFWRELKSNTRTKGGYRQFSLSRNGKLTTKKACTWVLEAFVGPKPKGNVIRHLNDIKTDDRLSNLLYGTYQENAEDARANGRLCQGESHGGAIWSEDVVRLVRKLKSEGATYPQITERTGVKKAMASQMVTRRAWKHVI